MAYLHRVKNGTTYYIQKENCSPIFSQPIFVSRLTCKLSEYGEYFYLFEEVDVYVGDPQLVDELDVDGHVGVVVYYWRAQDPRLQPSTGGFIYSGR